MQADINFPKSSTATQTLGTALEMTSCTEIKSSYQNCALFLRVSVAWGIPAFWKKRRDTTSKPRLIGRAEHERSTCRIRRVHVVSKE